MNVRLNTITSFKTKAAYNEFMKEAMNLETTLSRVFNHGRVETLSLYADDTGHIVTWYRQKDPAAMILDAEYQAYNKIPWQIRGSAEAKLYN